MAPGSCVHASSWTIDSSVDPENFHPDDLQQCLSTSSFEPTNLYHLLYSGLILQNFLPMQGGGYSRPCLLQEEIFHPKLWGCFKFSCFTELVQRLINCWLLFRPFDIFEGRVGLFLCGRAPCAISTPDMSIWNVSGFSLCTKPLLSLLVLQHFAFPTFWELE